MTKDVDGWFFSGGDMDRRGFLGVLFVLGAGGWIGLKGFFGPKADKGLKEAMYYNKLDGQTRSGDDEAA